MPASIASRRASASSKILEAQGLLVKVEDHALSVGVCDRCKTVVEPRVSDAVVLQDEGHWPKLPRQRSSKG